MIDTQMVPLHTQERKQILAALTPAHRALLAGIVGQLAIAPSPDPKAAAAKLDGALSASEKQSILKIHTSARDQMRAQMQKAHAEFLASLPADERQRMQAHMPPMPPGPPEMMRHNDSDPGSILLHVASMHPMGPMMIQMRHIEGDHGMPDMMYKQVPVPESLPSPK
ncbi:MAG: hypothetical protein JO293_09280 [Candidatus Eremiobacteraeota bacterium]|nr:hypothetical protein [Candidatus Eremiobacteraeota bacterium]